MRLNKINLFILASIALSANSVAGIGADTAADLNYRYNSYDECQYSGKAYDCTGIMIHTFDTDAQSWYPTDAGIDRGVVSFSWLRNDINIYKEGDYLGSIYGDNKVSGIIFYTTERALISEKEPAVIYCSYGANGESKSRSNYGCAMNKPNETIPNPNPDDYSSCYPLGIFTAEQLVEKYFINKEGAYEMGSFDQCSFSGEGEQFMEAMKVAPLARDYMVTPARNNEIIVKEWSLIEDQDVPLNAFYYTTNYQSGEFEAKTKVKSLQEEYYNLTGLFIPIIEIDMSIIRNSTSTDTPKPFIYNPEDQSILPPEA